MLGDFVLWVKASDFKAYMRRVIADRKAKIKMQFCIHEYSITFMTVNSCYLYKCKKCGRSVWRV